MIDVEEIKGRAMALGLEESYIDIDQCLLYSYGSLIFDLTNYILANTEEYSIEIPEGIEKVYICQGMILISMVSLITLFFPLPVIQFLKRCLICK